MGGQDGNVIGGEMQEKIFRRCTATDLNKGHKVIDAGENMR